MPITAITIENFKGIREPVRIELKPITLLFGPNSSGKSTIIQALHYAREIFERENTDPDRTLMGGDTIDLGGFKNLVHKHDTSLPITVLFDLDMTGEVLPTFDDGYVWDYYDPIIDDYTIRAKTVSVKISVRWSELAGKTIVTNYEIGLNGQEFAAITASSDGRQITLSKIELLHPVLLDKSTVDDEILDKLESTDVLSEDQLKKLKERYKPSSYIRFEADMDGHIDPFPLHNWKSVLPEFESNYVYEFGSAPWQDEIDLEGERLPMFHILSQLIIGPGQLVRDALRKFCYLGPLRVIPPRNFEPSLTPDESRWANGMAGWDILFNEDESFLEKVNNWLSGKNRLDSGYRVKVKEYKELDLTDPMAISMEQDSFLDEEEALPAHIRSLPTRRRLLLLEEANNIEVQPLDIGVGISQIIPVIVAGLSAKSGFVAIEQPDLHIHPKLQVAIGDLFIEQIKENPDVIFILETHSEHLMLRLLRRIRETSEGELLARNVELNPDQLSIYFSEQTEDGILLTSIRVDQDGDFIDRWPRGFFTERVKELF